MAHCKFTFGQIEELLAVVHRIDPAKRTAFQGRLKHLQRWGFPTGEKPGKGRSIDYSIEHLFKMVLALELIQAGLPPKLCVDLVADNWSAIRPTVYLNMFTATERRDHSGSEADWCWLVRPEAMKALTEDGEGKYDHMEAVAIVQTSELDKILGLDSSGFGGTLGAHWRTLVINGGPLVRGVMTLIEHRFGWSSALEMRKDMLEANEIAERRLSKAMTEFQSVFGDFTPSPRAPASERYPALIVSAAREVLGSFRLLVEKVAGVSGEVKLTKEEIVSLRDAGLMEVQAEGLVWTEKGQIVLELLEEEANGSNP